MQTIRGFIAVIPTQIIEAFRAFVVAGVKVILLCRVELRPLEFLARARRYIVIVVTRPVISGRQILALEHFSCAPLLVS